MNKKMLKLLCALLAVLLLAACRCGGEETTAPSDMPETVMPTESLPEGVGVEDWDEPVETDPVETTAPNETTAPTEETTPADDPTVPTDAPTEPSAPIQTTPAVEPTDPPAPPQTEPPATGSADPAALTYEEYLAMTPAQQQAHYEQFPSLEAYIAWHNAALAAYEDSNISIEVTGGIDIGDFMGP